MATYLGESEASFCVMYMYIIFVCTGVCNELTGPPTQVVRQDHLCHHKWSPRTSCVRHKWSPAAVSGPPYLWGAICLKTTFTLMFSTGIDI